MALRNIEKRLYGAIHHIEDGKLVRTTFVEGHLRYGEIRHFQDGKHVRNTYEP